MSIPIDCYMFQLRVFGFVLRCAISLAIALGSLTLAANESVVPIDLSRSVNASPDNFRVMQNVPAHWTLENVLAEPASRFAVLNTDKNYPTSSDRAIWLHFQIISSGSKATSTVVFEFQKSYVDEVQFHFQNDQGHWLVQTAGKLTARADWPLRGLYPRFELPTTGADVQNIYVKVQQFLPIRVDVDLKPLNVSNYDMQQKAFLYGLNMGLLALMSIFGLVLAVAYRQSLYVWFSMYSALASVSSANYLGLPNYVELLEVLNWSGSSIIVSALAVALIKLKFCYATFSRDLSARWIKKAVQINVVIAVVCIVGILALPYGDLNKRVLFFIAFGTNTMMLLAIIGLAIHKRSTIGWLWLLAFLPVTTLLLLTAIDATGLAAIPRLSAAALVYARTFEVIVLLLAMQLHVKSLHAGLVRSRTLDELDPLTGFLTALQYPDALASMWSHARSNREDLAVAYIRAAVGLDAFQAANQPSDDELVMRCVRMLRMVVRRDDTVARIDKNVFAILMPGVSTGPNLADKLARLVALGGMHDTDDSTHIPVKFQIAATTFMCFKSTSGQLNEALWQKLNMMAQTNDKAIEFIAK